MRMRGSVPIRSCGPPHAMKSDRHPMAKMCARNRPAFDLPGVEYGQTTRTPVFIEDVGEQVTFALARVDVPGHEHRLRDRTARSRRVDLHPVRDMIEATDPAVKEVLASGAADAGNKSVAIPFAHPALVDAGVLASFLAQRFHRKIAGLAPIE